MSSAPRELRPPSILRTAVLVARKDLTIAFRDRQTWINTILMPLLLYPVMFFVMIQVVALVSDQQAAREVRIAIAGPQAAAARLEALRPQLEAALRLNKSQLASLAFGSLQTKGPGAPAEGSKKPAPMGPGTPAAQGTTAAASAPDASAAGEQKSAGLTHLELWSDADRETLEGALRSNQEAGASDPGSSAASSAPSPASAGVEQAPDQGAADLGAIGAPAHPGGLEPKLLEAGLWVPAEGPPELLFDSARPASLVAKERLLEALEATGLANRDQALEAVGLTLSDLKPLRSQRQDLAAARDTGAFVLSLLLPMMLVVMGMLGAFYPAVDLTAGERERGSYETGLIAPIPRLGLALGKLSAVTTSAFLGASMNLVGIGFAANHLLGLLGGAERIEVTIPWLMLLCVLPLLLAYLLLVAATLTAAASMTETFKQGQALLGSVQLVFILPAMVATLPGLQLTHGLASIPVVGFTLAVRQVLRTPTLADLPLGPLATCFASHLILAALAAWLAARLLTRSPDAGTGWAAARRLLQRPKASA